MYQNTLNNFNTIAKNLQYNENFLPNTPNKQQGLIRSASTSCAIIDNNNLNQPKAPPRRKKRGESLSSNKLSSANSSQYSLVMNYAYSEIDPNMINTNTLKQNHWTPNSTLRRYMSSDMTGVNYNKPYNANFNDQFQKPIGVLEQVINRTIPTPPPRISSAKNTLRRRSYVESIMNPMEPPIKPNRQKIQTSGLNQSQFDIPGTPITTHLPPQSSNQFSTLTRPSVNLSSINLTQQNANFNQLPINSSRANLDNYQMQPFYNKTMSLDNLNAVALRQNLRRSPTREELFDYIVQQQGQLSELKTQQKVLEKQVDLAHKEASKAHHHHHHHKHRHRKARTAKENDNLENNSIDSSSMISSERKTSERRSHHKSSRINKNLTAEANKQVHDHIKQLQEQLELIRQKRRKIKTDKNAEHELEQIDHALDKSIDSSFLDNINKKLNSKDLIKDKKGNSVINDNLLKLPTNRSKDRESIDETHSNLLSPIQTPLSSNRSPLNSRSSSIERAITKRELLRESAKEKWNRSFIEDFADEQLIKELNKNSANQDLLKELLPKISVNQDDKNNYLKYNEILEKNLKLNQTPNWLTDSLDEHTYGEKSPTSEPLSPFSGRTGVFRPINKDNNAQTKLDLLTNNDKDNSNFTSQNRSLNSPRPNYDLDNIEGFITKKDNNLITGNIDLSTNNAQQQQLQQQQLQQQLQQQQLQQQQQDLLLLKKQEDKLIEKLETELMNEKLKQNELMNKKLEIENRQMEHELELEKTRQQLIEQQNLFQEQQQLLQNQRQELEIERWRMEQEKQQLLYEHEMSAKRDQLDQQQALNQQLEQQRLLYEQQLQAQRAMQEQLKNELEHQKQLQIKNQQQQQSILNNQAAALSKLHKQQEHQKQEQLQQQKVYQQQLQNQQLQQKKQLEQQQQQFQNQKQQQQKQLEQQQQQFQNQKQQQQKQLEQQLQKQQKQQQQQLQLEQQLQKQQQQLQTDMSANLINPLPTINPSSANKKFQLNSPLQSLQSLLPTSLQSKSFVQQQQQQLQQQHQQIQNQLHDQLQQTSQTNLMNLINEPSSSSKPRRHRLGQDESPFSSYKPPIHSNSKLNLFDSPKNSFQAINLTTPNISTEHQRPASPRPPFTSNPGLLSSNSSLTRIQPVGFSSKFNKQPLNRTSQENLSRSRQKFYGSNEFDQMNKTSNQYFGSGGNLNKTEIMNNNLSNLNNLNRSTGSLHLQQDRLISGQLQPHNLQPQHLSNRNQLSTDNYQLDHYDQKKYSSNTNLNHPRRNSAMDPFRDHFDQYFTPKKQTSTTNLNKPTSLQHKVSNIDLTITPVNNNIENNKNLIGSSSNLIEKSTNVVNKIELKNQTTPLTAVKDVLLEPLDKLNKDGLTEYQGLGNRRLTLPELPRAEFNKETEQIKGYTINKAQPNDNFSTSANRRKNSLPDNVKSAAAIIKPGWDREEVSHLAHEAREAKAKAAELNTTQVKMIEFKDWLISNLFLISLIIFNLSIFYVYLQFIEPIDE